MHRIIECHVAMWLVFMLSHSPFCHADDELSRDEGLAAAVEAIRTQHDLPALAAAIVTTQGVQFRVATGVRKKEMATPATEKDLWHLGSCGKAMTATLIARLVESGELRFGQTLGESFPDEAERMPEAFRAVTLRQLLSHRSGLPANFQLGLYSAETNPTAARRRVLEEAITTPLLSAPGTEFLYSNFGYTLAGHVTERVTGEPFETLMRRHVFGPLNMETAGFGGTGTLGHLDQPWPHTANGRPAPFNGPTMDNLPVMAPAGTMHMSLDDWSRFVVEHLKGSRGESEFLDAVTYQELHTPCPEAIGEDHYACGWMSLPRAWAGEGPGASALTHSGDNTMNHATVWVAPELGFAVLIATNQSMAQGATDDVANALIKAHLGALE